MSKSKPLKISPKNHVLILEIISLTSGILSKNPEIRLVYLNYKLADYYRLSERMLLVVISDLTKITARLR